MKPGCPASRREVGVAIPLRDTEDIFVIFPLFSRPVRASFGVGRVVTSEQIATLADRVSAHLQQLVSVVEILKRAGWEVIGEETALICRHPAVRTKAQAEVALRQLGIDYGTYGVCDPTEMEQQVPSVAHPEDPMKAP